MSWHWSNWLVLAGYFLFIVGIGVYFSNKNKSTQDYFTASGRIPSWVNACSEIYKIILTRKNDMTFVEKEYL